jgi:hypothetical protein
MLNKNLRKKRSINERRYKESTLLFPNSGSLPSPYPQFLHPQKVTKTILKFEREFTNPNETDFSLRRRGAWLRCSNTGGGRGEWGRWRSAGGHTRPRLEDHAMEGDDVNLVHGGERARGRLLRLVQLGWVYRGVTEYGLCKCEARQQSGIVLPAQTASTHASVPLAPCAAPNHTPPPPLPAPGEWGSMEEKVRIHEC